MPCVMCLALADDFLFGNKIFIFVPNMVLSLVAVIFTCL